LSSHLETSFIIIIIIIIIMQRLTRHVSVAVAAHVHACSVVFMSVLHSAKLDGPVASLSAGQTLAGGLNNPLGMHVCATRRIRLNNPYRRQRCDGSAVMGSAYAVRRIPQFRGISKQGGTGIVCNHSGFCFLFFLVYTFFLFCFLCRAGAYRGQHATRSWQCGQTRPKTDY